jgi:hypothetical protein
MSFGRLLIAAAIAAALLVLFLFAVREGRLASPGARAAAVALIALVALLAWLLPIR